MKEPLRPFTLGEILDRTALLYRRNFLLLAGVAAAPTGALVAVFVIFGATIAFFGVTAKGTIAPHVLTVVLILAAVLVGLPVGIAATVFSHAALTRTAVSAHMGERLTIRAALQGVMPRFWRYLWLMVLQGVFAALIPAFAAAGVVGIVAVLANLVSGAGASWGTGLGLGFLAFLVIAATVVVVIIRALGYSMAMAVCVVEEMPAWESLNRSMKLSKGTRGRIFVMALLVWALSIVLSMIAYIPMMLIVATVTAVGHGTQYAVVTTIVAEILNFLVNFALQTLLAPVYITALMLFYYDQRIRTEGYDIEWMMAQAGLTSVRSSSGAIQAGNASEPPGGPDTVKVS
jgi:uncharacterized membrane protein